MFRLLLRIGGWRVGGPSVPGSLGRPPTPCPGLTAVLLSAPLAVGRKQFMRFEWANHAAEALGCEYEELNTATFKHHLRQIIEQVTSGSGRRGLADEETSSGRKAASLGGQGPRRARSWGHAGIPSPIHQGCDEGLPQAGFPGAHKCTPHTHRQVIFLTQSQTCSRPIPRTCTQTYTP